LTQRNALLRKGRDRQLPRDAFGYWDQQLIALGAEIVTARLGAVAALNHYLAVVHPRFADSGDPVHVSYRSSVPLLEEADVLGERVREGEVARVREYVSERFTAHLTSLHPRERQQGATLAGPHRDDLVFLAGTVDLRTYGSRGQQRSAALALKLAEVGLMRQYTSEPPVLLLDDVMSELDRRRRRFIQDVVAENEQIIMTATDLDFFQPEFLQRAAVFEIEAGAIRRSAA
jgi:DNA replication and repair protein RecF